MADVQRQGTDRQPFNRGIRDNLDGIGDLALEEGHALLSNGLAQLRLY